MTSRQKMAFRVGVVAIAAVGVFLTWRVFTAQAVSASGHDESEAAPVPVRVYAVVHSDELQMTRTYTGVVKSSETSRLGFELGGEVESIQSDEGHVMKTGQVIAVLDQRRQIARRDEIAAQLASARALLDELVEGPRDEAIRAAEAVARRLDIQRQLAGNRLNRREGLVDDGALSKEELDETRFQVEAIQAQLDEANAFLEELTNGTRDETRLAQEGVVAQLEASLDQAEIEIDQSKLVAPFDGVVVERTLDTGTIVAAGQAVVELESLDREVWIGCPPEIIDDLNRAKSYPITIGEQSFQASIRSIIPRVNRATRTQTVIFQLADAEEPIPTGLIASLSIEQTIETKGFWVPVTALSPGTHGLWAAYVLNEADGRVDVNRRDVELIHLDGERAFVRGTLDDGDEVILEGVHRLSPEQLVTPSRVDNPWSTAEAGPPS